MNILYVEDNEMNRELLSRRLERVGFSVSLAFDGPAGVAAAIRDRPDLILMDINLGPDQMDGWQTTRLIKADPKTASIPVIAVTAHSTAEARQKSLAAGCCEFETKPVDFLRLERKIREALKGVGADAEAMGAARA